MVDLIDVTKQRARDKIQSFEKIMHKVPGALIGDNELCPLKHSFAHGIYVREIFIPKGLIIVGKIHKYEHPNFLMKGDVTVITEHGGTERLKAPLAMISPPATKRVVYAHEDVVWITCHRTDETNIEKIENEVIAKSYDELPEFAREHIKIEN